MPIFVNGGVGFSLSVGSIDVIWVIGLPRSQLQVTHLLNIDFTSLVAATIQYPALLIALSVDVLPR